MHLASITYTCSNKEDSFLKAPPVYQVVDSNNTFDFEDGQKLIFYRIQLHNCLVKNFHLCLQMTNTTDNHLVQLKKSNLLMHLEQLEFLYEYV